MKGLGPQIYRLIVGYEVLPGRQKAFSHASHCLILRKDMKLEYSYFER